MCNAQPAVFWFLGAEPQDLVYGFISWFASQIETLVYVSQTTAKSIIAREVRPARHVRQSLFRCWVREQVTHNTGHLLFCERYTTVARFLLAFLGLPIIKRFLAWLLTKDLRVPVVSEQAL